MTPAELEAAKVYGLEWLKKDSAFIHRTAENGTGAEKEIAQFILRVTKEAPVEG